MKEFLWENKKDKITNMCKNKIMDQELFTLNNHWKNPKKTFLQIKALKILVKKAQKIRCSFPMNFHL